MQLHHHPNSSKSIKHVANISKRIGMLTPSSNTVLEPVTAAMLQGVPDVTAHFARLRVLKISLAADALNQFSTGPMLQAADLLSDARVDAICWNGTSSGWLGFDSDLQLCRQIEGKTGIPTGTSVLALNEILQLQNVKDIAFITPYLEEIQSAIINNYQCNGYHVVAERHLGDPGNYSFCEYTQDQIMQMCRDVCAAKPQAICVFCTNFRGASIAAAIERETGIPVYDTVSTALWKSLMLCDIKPSVVKGWGSVFDVC